MPIREVCLLHHVNVNGHKLGNSMNTESGKDADVKQIKGTKINEIG
jgi:hypothetical protein